MNEQMIQYLLRKVEQRSGRKMESPNDFKRLSEQLPLNEPLSTSTLKRLWGYVASDHVPREETLSILARFTGFEDWNDFCQRNSKAFESDFLYEVIKTETIVEGEELVIEWLPDRRCRIRKQEGERWTVVEAENCKLQVGDTFRATWFAVGQPLCASSVERNGQPLADYIAGRHHGLSKVEIV